MEYLNKREVDSNTILYCREIIDFFDKTKCKKKEHELKAIHNTNNMDHISPD